MIRPAAVVLAAALAAGLAVGAPAAAQRPVDPGSPAAAMPASARPLSGVRIALDAGHQLGNSRFPARIQRPVPAGGFRKPCNTTGTATADGYPEATLTFAVVRGVKRRLERLGATVLLTRSVNSSRTWGPCVDARGRFGARAGAALMVSVHADGAPSSARGFHVITPAARAPWTTDIAEESRRLALAVRAGFDARLLPRSTYVNRGYGLDTRSDLATLNLSDVPVVMVEVGNMRNPGDARRMTSSAGRSRYADALVAGIREYLGR